MVVVLGLAMASPSASAHALLLASEPANGAVVDTPPARVLLAFTERPDPQLSIVHVLDGSGTAVERGPARSVDGQPESLTVALPPLAKGVYTVTWRTTSAVDGHTTAGSFSFGVGVTPPGRAADAKSDTQTPRPTVGGVAGRWLLYLGAALLVGFAAVRCALGAGGVGDTRRRIVLLAWLFAAGGVVVTVLDERAVAHVGITTLLRSRAGVPIRSEAIALAFTAVAIIAWWARPSMVRGLLVGGGASVVMLTRAAAGHASAGRSPSFPVAIQTLHLIAGGVWVGGLPFFVAALRRAAPDRRAPLAGRFSRLATVGLVVVVATGMLRTLDEVGAWNRFTRTGFGQTLLVKLGLVAILLALAAVNRFRNVARARGSGDVIPLRRTARTEAVIAVGVLAVTALMTGLAPPASVAKAAGSATSSRVTVTGSDFATTTRVRLVVTPGLVGRNTFDAVVTDYDTGRAIDASAVRFRFKSLDRPTVAESTLALQRTRAGHWVAQGTTIATDGAWTVTAAIDTARGGVEVPLLFEPSPPPQKISVQREAGLPTFYTVTTGDGRQVQIYLDPGHPGLNELHATYLALSGQELVVQSFVARANRVGSSTASEELVTRKLDDAGHFVADLQTVRGTYRTRCAGTLADGTTITTVLDIPVT